MAQTGSEMMIDETDTRAAYPISIYLDIEDYYHVRRAISLSPRRFRRPAALYVAHTNQKLDN
jgi:hypothetical protein